jgi:hypothetical protein
MKKGTSILSILSFPSICLQSRVSPYKESQPWPSEAPQRFPRGSFSDVPDTHQKLNPCHQDGMGMSSSHCPGLRALRAGVEGSEHGRTNYCRRNTHRDQCDTYPEVWRSEGNFAPGEPTRKRDALEAEASTPPNPLLVSEFAQD